MSVNVTPVNCDEDRLIHSWQWNRVCRNASPEGATHGEGVDRANGDVGATGEYQ